MPKAQGAVMESWDEVGTRFETFGKHVRQHFASGSAASSADRVQLEKSARALVSTVEDTLAAAGGVIKDTKLRQDLAELASAIRDALVTSLDSAGTLIRPKSQPKTPPKAAPHKTATREAHTRAHHGDGA